MIDFGYASQMSGFLFDIDLGRLANIQGFPYMIFSFDLFINFSREIDLLVPYCLLNKKEDIDTFM